jgi:hypothetical protein
MDEERIWHYFNPNFRGSYPIVRTRIQVKLTNGAEVEGDWAEFFSQDALSLPLITAWRYVRSPRT